MKKIKNIYLLSLSIGLLSVAAILSSPNVTRAYTATEYSTSEAWSVGMLVALDNAGKVTGASNTTDNYLGVVTNQSKGKVVVADTGLVSVLVSDREGAITAGVRLGLSDIIGTATLWHSGDILVGVAKEAPKNWQEVKAKNNSTQTIRIASIQVQLTRDSKSVTSVAGSFTNTIAKTASSIAGHQVDTWRIVTGLFIGLGGLILSFGLLFVSSRESFFSLGRNPMASTAIMAGLWKMAILCVLSMCVSLASAYLIVRVG